MPMGRLGFSDIKTALKIKIRSRPNNVESRYLNLFVMNQEKARLEQERLYLNKRKRKVETAIKDIQKMTDKAEQSMRTKKNKQIHNNAAGNKASGERSFNTVVLNY